MAKTLSNSQEKQQYEVLKECWIEGIRYLPTQLVKLTPNQAREWLDRKCIKELKQTKQARNTSQNAETIEDTAKIKDTTK